MKLKELAIIEITLILIAVIVTSGAKLQRSQLWPSTGRLQPSDDITDPHIHQQFVQVKEWADKLQEMLDTTFRKVSGIPFNQSESLTVADSGTHDTEFTVSHHLDRLPVGFIVTTSDKACSVYDSGTTWTTSAIYLKCDVNSVALTLSVF